VYTEPDVLPSIQGSVTASSTAIPGAAVDSDPEERLAMSIAFVKMYRTMLPLLSRSVKANELKDVLWCFCHPQFPKLPFVDRSVYEGATSTKAILKQLCPKFINYADLRVLKGILNSFRSPRCNKLLKDFENEFN
jgi:hypothetical protein